MLSKIIILTFTLTNAHVLWITGKIERLADDFISECVNRGTRCNPYIENPCCENDDICNLVGFTENQNIYICLKQEQLEEVCQSDSDCSEIDNAKCNGNKRCQCRLNYAAINGTECMPLLDGKCSKDNDCIVNHSVCFNNQCACEPGFIPKSNDQCIRSQLGNLCHYDNDCNDVSHIKCSEDHICICRSHHVMKNLATCESLLGGYCQRTRECAPSKSVCIDNKCQCKDGYLLKTPEKCVPTPLGNNCQVDSECDEVLFAECSEDKQCDCKQGYVEVNKATCAPLLGEFCLLNEPCAVDNSVCIDNKCQCKPKFIAENNDKCVTRTSCSNDYDCGDIWHSECSGKKECVCRKNRTLTDDSKCLPLLGEDCKSYDKCAPDNSICLFNKCQCKIYYKSVSNNQCIPRQLGESCKVNHDCKAINAVCSLNKMCVCRDNNVFLNNSKCAPLLGGFCDANNSCVIVNSVCVDNQCQCKTNFTPISNNQCLSFWQ